jgi:hypothetical protein
VCICACAVNAAANAVQTQIMLGQGTDQQVGGPTFEYSNILKSYNRIKLYT